MNDVIAPEAPPKINFTEFNVRQERGRPHFVRLNDSVVKRLERQLTDRPPVAGSERFGLLLGSVETGDSCTIAVEDFEPTAKLEERIRTWTPPAGSQRKIVGYYRTHSQAEFGLDGTDQGLFARCFPAGSRVTLLLKPPAAGVGAAMFFLSENGGLVPDRATVEFPFNLRELGAEDGPGPAPAVVTVPVPAAKPAPVAAPKPVRAAAPKPVPSVAAKPAPVPAPKPAPVAPAPKAATPVAAVAEPKPTPTRSARGGILLKIAMAGVVTIFTVFGLSELRVFDAPAKQPTREATVATPNPAAAISEPAAKPDPAPSEPEAAVVSKPAAPKPPPVKAPAPKASAPHAVTPARPALVAESTIQKPGSVPPEQPAVTPPVVKAQSQPLAPAPAATAPPASSDRPSVRQPAIVAPASKPPAPKAVESVTPMTPPHAIRQYAPILPEKVRRSISGEVVVRVKVAVDASGRVTSAEPVSGDSPVSDAVASTAVGAVKHWQFEPARRGDEKVPSDVILSFTFRK